MSQSMSKISESELIGLYGSVSLMLSRLQPRAESFIKEYILKMTQDSPVHYIDMRDEDDPVFGMHRIGGGRLLHKFTIGAVAIIDDAIYLLLSRDEMDVYGEDLADLSAKEIEESLLHKTPLENALWLNLEETQSLKTVLNVLIHIEYMIWDELANNGVVL